MCTNACSLSGTSTTKVVWHPWLEWALRRVQLCLNTRQGLLAPIAEVIWYTSDAGLLPVQAVFGWMAAG